MVLMSSISYPPVLRRRILFLFSTSQKRYAEYSGPSTEISSTNHASFQYRSNHSCRAGAEEGFTSYCLQEHFGERHMGFMIWPCKTQVLGT